MLEEKSFDAVITDGRIHHEENLRPWEGQAVQVTLQLQTGDDDLPDDMDIERDVYVKMSAKTFIVRPTTVRDVGHAKPFLILPEGLEDE